MAFSPMADYGSALQAATAILGTLIGREHGGDGAYLDVAVADWYFTWQAYGLTQAALATVGQGTKPTRGDDLLNGGAACYQVYATADGRFISLGAIEEVFWCNFCQALGRDDWIARHTETMPQMGLIAELSEVIASEPREYWDRALGAVDCCYHPVLDYTEVAS